MRSSRLACASLFAAAACASSRSPGTSDAPPAPGADAPIIDARVPAIDASRPDAPVDAATLGPPGLSWPSEQVFPSFAQIAALDVIGSSGRPADVMTLLVTLEGVVNRARPRIYIDSGSDSDRLWLTEIGAPTAPASDPLALVAKYAGELAGVVITDDAQPDTLNLATTIAGETGAIVASPALAATLTAPPYSLHVVSDLRALHLTSKLAVYQYQLDHYASAATHRMIIGLTPAIPGHLRDYAVACGAMVVWLDPRDAAEKQMLSKYLALLSPNSPYLGWWVDEPTGVAAASSFGVPVYAADWSANLTVLGGTARGSAPPPAATAPPRLDNKVYVSIFMSDGDNLQEDQGLIPLKWARPSRGQVPVGWTVNPALVDVAPVILRYFQRTATDNDVLVSGPSGLGYTYPAAWPAGAFDAYAQRTGAYMDAARLRVITVWNNGVDLSDADAHAYAQHIPGLVGMTIQDGSQPLRWVDGKVPLVRMALSYGDTAAILQSGIDGQLAKFTGAAPVFVAVQGNMNMGTIDPDAFAQVAQHYAQNSNVVFVRPDHFFQLLDTASHPAAHRVLDGDFDGDGKADELFYHAGTGDWWMARSDGAALTWHKAGNTSGFGNLLDGGHLLTTGDFDHDGKTDVLFYFQGDGNWWVGRSDGDQLAWHKAATTATNLLDGKHRVFTGDYTGDGRTDVLTYASADGAWSMGVSDGTALAFHAAGNTGGFGNLLDGSHALYEGDWNGDGKRDLMFYYVGDGNWWMGLSDGATIAWHGAGNTAGFGNLIARDHRVLVGDFDGDHRSDVMFHYAGDGAWWMGLSDGATIAWHAAGASTGEHLLDWSHRLYVGDADGDHKSDVIAYDAGAGRFTIGRSDGVVLTWHAASDVAGFGNLADPSRLLFVADYDGDGKAEPLFYYGGDGNWWMSQSDGATFAWHQAANTSGFGDLTH
jgi:hypothetical protein